MVRVGDVWDRTADVLAARAGVLAPVALIGFFLPAAAQATVKAFGGGSTAAAALAVPVWLLALIAAAWGQLTVAGLAGEPQPLRKQAVALAWRRLPRALLVILLLIAVAIAALLPIVIILAATGFDFQAAASGHAKLTPGAAALAFLWALIVAVAALWLGARLALVVPVVLHEGRGIGALRRSWALTRGLTMPLIGLALLLGLVWAVAGTAARFLLFFPVRLLAGEDATAVATFAGALGVAAVGAVVSTVLAAFAARAYIAVVGPRAA